MANKNKNKLNKTGGSKKCKKCKHKKIYWKKSWQRDCIESTRALEDSAEDFTAMHHRDKEKKMTK